MLALPNLATVFHNTAIQLYTALCNVIAGLCAKMPDNTEGTPWNLAMYNVFIWVFGYQFERHVDTPR